VNRLHHSCDRSPAGRYFTAIDGLSSSSIRVLTGRCSTTTSLSADFEFHAINPSYGIRCTTRQPQIASNFASGSPGPRPATRPESDRRACVLGLRTKKASQSSSFADMTQTQTRNMDFVLVDRGQSAACLRRIRLAKCPECRQLGRCMYMNRLPGTSAKIEIPNDPFASIARSKTATHPRSLDSEF